MFLNTDLIVMLLKGEWSRRVSLEEGETRTQQHFTNTSSEVQLVKNWNGQRKPHNFTSPMPTGRLQLPNLNNEFHHMAILEMAWFQLMLLYIVSSFNILSTNRNSYNRCKII